MHALAWYFNTSPKVDHRTNRWCYFLPSSYILNLLSSNTKPSHSPFFLLPLSPTYDKRLSFYALSSSKFDTSLEVGLAIDGPHLRKHPTEAFWVHEILTFGAFRKLFESRMSISHFTELEVTNLGFGRIANPLTQTSPYIPAMFTVESK